MPGHTVIDGVPDDRGGHVVMQGGKFRTDGRGHPDRSRVVRFFHICIRIVRADLGITGPVDLASCDRYPGVMLDKPVIHFRASGHDPGQNLLVMCDDL